jgi:Retroviral aspartyl protease
MSDNAVQSTYFSVSDEIESNQADKIKNPAPYLAPEPNQVTEQSGGQKLELTGERVMRRSATTTREVKLCLSFWALDTREVFSTTALLDSGTTDSFIDKGMIDCYGLEVIAFDRPIPVFNADGGRNKLGDITGYVDLEMSIRDHKEIMQLHATSLGQERIFIGHDWLRKHNPDINWESGEVSMSQCPKRMCGYKYHQKRAEKQ